jgi:cell division protein FtsW
MAAWLIAEGKMPGSKVWGATIALGLFLMVGAILKGQPDIGMLLVVSAVFFAQFFVAGMNLFLVGAVGGIGIAGAVGAYLLFPHVQSRVQRFLDPESGDSYQVSVAMEAFANGGLLGRGPGEGRVKNVLPDAHADFVFAVAGEEFGMVICLVILGLFAFIVVRGLARLLSETDLFVMLAGTGLLTQFGLQAFVNMASTLHLIPTKGMTLPFVSYGGSSVLAIAMGMGMLLALTRRRIGARGGDAVAEDRGGAPALAGGLR